MRDASDPLSAIAYVQPKGIELPDGFTRYAQLSLEQADQLLSQTNECLERHTGRTADGLTDWQKVEGIVGCLRNEFRHVPRATAPEGCTDVVKYFLETKQGPDYLFASTAASMVRAFGIPSRLVTGFYASPQHYDLKSGQTEVLPEHLHTWAEVYCHGIWLPIEPTPGFALPNEYRTWSQWAIESGWAIRDALYHHPIRYALGISGALFLFLLRQRLADAALSVLSLATGLTPLRVQVRSINRLLRWRSWLYGQYYPLRCTIFQRLETQLIDNPGLTTVGRFAYIRAAERIAYAPKGRTTEWLDANAMQIRSACWAIATSGCKNLFSIPTSKLWQPKRKPQ